MNSGWIKLHRQLLNWEWYSDVNVRLLFIHLLLKANYEDSNYKGLPVKRGQVIVGRKETPMEVGISAQQYRTALNKLKSTNEITIKATNKFSIVTLLNYSVYQDNNSEDNQQVTNNPTINQPTSNQQVTTSKEEQELKKNKEKNTQNFFTKFYSEYPVHKSKVKAKQKFCVLLKNSKEPEKLFEQIMQGVRNYNALIKTENTEARFIKHPPTWLNDGCWEDEQRGGQKSTPLIKPTIESNRYSGLRDFTAERLEEERKLKLK